MRNAECGVADNVREGDVFIEYAATPTHRMEELIGMQIELPILTVKTSNGYTRATKCSQIQVTTSNGVKTPTKAYTLPKSQHDLLWLADIIDAVEAVVFTRQGACAGDGDIIKQSTVEKNLLAKKMGRT